MIVYYFVNAKYGLQNIRHRRLKVSNLMDLNDPFEFLGVNLSDKAFRKVLNAKKAELAKTRGLLCFNSKWTNPVHWAHYADRYRGICLGFKVADEILEKVEYVGKRPTAPSVLDEKELKRLMLRKFHHWHYESEYRAFVTLKKKVDGLHFQYFDKQFVLKRVIVGHQSKVTRAQIAEAIGDLPDVEVFPARPAFQTFSVVRQKNPKKWK